MAGYDRLMINLREAGFKRTVVHSRKGTSSTAVVSTWRPATRSVAGDTEFTSIGAVSNPKQRGQIGIGTMTFRDMIGYEEFYVDLGGDDDHSSGWEQPSTESETMHVEQGSTGRESDHETFEMTYASPSATASVSVVGGDQAV